MKLIVKITQVDKDIFEIKSQGGLSLGYFTSDESKRNNYVNFHIHTTFKNKIKKMFFMSNENVSKNLTTKY